MNRFEAQLTAVKERLEAAKQGSTRGLVTSMEGPAGFSNGLGSRIAKPLRGGGGVAETNGGASIPTVSGLQQESSGKRGSWFFDRR
jgi:kinesin family protein 5